MAVACRRRAVPALGRRLPDRREAAGARWRKVGPMTGTDRAAVAPGRNGLMRRMRGSFGTFAGQPGDPRAFLRHHALLRDLAVVPHRARYRRRAVLRHRARHRRLAVLRHRAAAVCRRIACRRQEPRNERITESRRRSSGLADGRLAEVAAGQARERRIARGGDLMYRTQTSGAAGFAGTRHRGPRDRGRWDRPPGSPPPWRRRRRATARPAGLRRRRANGLRPAGALPGRRWMPRTRRRRVQCPMRRTARGSCGHARQARDIRLTWRGSLVDGRSPLPRS